MNESIISDNDVASKSGSAILDSTHEHHHHHHGEHVKVFIFYFLFNRFRPFKQLLQLCQLSC
jgi:hypothetical protein